MIQLCHNFDWISVIITPQCDKSERKYDWFVRDSFIVCDMSIIFFPHCWAAWHIVWQKWRFCLICEWVMSHIWLSHACHIWLSHVTRHIVIFISVTRRTEMKIFWVMGTLFAPAKTCLTFWGLPWKLVKNPGTPAKTCLTFSGLPWKLVKNPGTPVKTCWIFCSREYLKSDLLRVLIDVMFHNDQYNVRLFISIVQIMSHRGTSHVSNTKQTRLNYEWAMSHRQPARLSRLRHVLSMSQIRTTGTAMSYIWMRRVTPLCHAAERVTSQNKNWFMFKMWFETWHVRDVIHRG